MDAASFFRSKGMTAVAGRTYPGTFAIVKKNSFLAEQVDNRDSASWKKAEHIVIDEIQGDQGQSILPRWRMLTAAEPVGRSIQKLYVAVNYGQYVMYDAVGNNLGVGCLADVVK